MEITAKAFLRRHLIQIAVVHYGKQVLEMTGTLERKRYWHCLEVIELGLMSSKLSTQYIICHWLQNQMNIF